MKTIYTFRNAMDVALALAASGKAKERERWPRERIRDYQQQQLGALVEHASTNSPFYRELYGGRIAARDVRLDSLPPVTKAQMMDRLDDFVTSRDLRRDALEQHLQEVGAADELFLGQYRVMASSGSSGRKGIYVYDRSAWRVFLGGALRWSAMMGLVPRFPKRRRLAQVAAPDAKHMTARGAASMSVGLFLPLRISATEPIERIVDVLNRQQPDALTGYPSVLDLLALEQLAGRLRIAPSIVSTTSEVRTPEMTARLREAWGSEPFNCLGLTETGITAADCDAHCGMHIYEDACILEVVDEDGRAVPPGTPGHKVFLTNLYNRSQPFVRFEVTDLVTVDESPCPCGRSFARIVAIEGRSDDILEMPRAGGGSIKVHPIHLRSPLAAMPAVAQYQVVQTREGLEVTLALANGADAGQVRRSVEDALDDKLQSLGVIGSRIAVSVVDRIAREEGAGKFKLIKAAPR
jgi:phenylacetate-CoA ligase